MLPCKKQHIYVVHRQNMSFQSHQSTPALHSPGQPSASLLAAQPASWGPEATKALGDDFFYCTHAYHLALTSNPSSVAVHKRIVCKVSTNKRHFL